jgi:23S rRNA (adenine2503-C2)-methyltransferase
VSTAEHDSNDPLTWLPADWERFIASRGERPYRAMQVFRWIHKRGVADAAKMTDLGKSLRDVIATAGLRMPSEVAHVHRDPDGTQKALVRFPDGGQVETVLIPPLARDDAERDDDDADTDESADANSGMTAPLKRVTQCISSQVGCAMGCVFCASGVAGLKRNMTAGEIVSQVLLGRALLPTDEALRNVVLMGMGEPLHNYGNVQRTLQLLTHREGIGLSTRRVTVSTSGLVPEIDRLGTEFRGQVALAVSLHAPSDALRSELMPINRRYPLAELMAALKRYPLPPRRRITIEYTLIQGINDGPDEARALARLLRGIPVKINLIPMNPIPSTPFQMPAPERIEAFQSALRHAGFSVFVRKQRGDEVNAACGQLALHGAEPKRRRLPQLPGAEKGHG